MNTKREIVLDLACLALAEGMGCGVCRCNVRGFGSGCRRVRWDSGLGPDKMDWSGRDGPQPVFNISSF